MLLTTQPWSALSPVVVLEPLTPSRISYLTLYLGYTVVDPLDGFIHELRQQMFSSMGGTRFCPGAMFTRLDSTRRRPESIVT